MANVTYRVSGLRDGERLRGRFKTGPEARAFARTLSNAVIKVDAAVRIDGREVSKTFTRKSDADAWVTEVEHAKGAGGAIDPRRSRVTVGDYAEDWLAHRHDLSPTTASLYAHLLNKHILPTFGSVAMGKVTTSAVRAWHASIASEHPTTAAKAYRLLSTIMRAAVVDRLIIASPCQVPGAATEKAPERPLASLAEVQALTDAMPDGLRLVVVLGTWAQLRRGELLGLRRRDIDLVHGTLTVVVTRTVTVGRQEVVKGPKTAAGRRTLALPSQVIAEVEHHLAHHVDPHPDAYLFTATPKEVRGAWERARRSIGRPDLHLHDLRHTGLTLAAMTGATVAELMHRAGHSTPTMAMGYQHATADRDRALANALAALVPPAPVVPLDPARSRGTEHAAG